MRAPLSFALAAVCLSACSSASGSRNEVLFAASDPHGGVVQTTTEAAADEQMRTRCPGGYRITHAEERGDSHRYTYECSRWYQASR